MNTHERAAKLFEKAESLGLEAPTESMMADAFGDVAYNCEMEFLGWLNQTDENLAKRFLNEIELKSIENLEE